MKEMTHKISGYYGDVQYKESVADAQSERQPDESMTRCEADGILHLH